MNTQLAQLISAPIPEPVSLGLVLAGLAVVWFRNFQIVPATKRSTRNYR